MLTKYKEKGAALVGAKCGITLGNMEKVIGEYAESAPDLPLWARPNAGLPRIDGETNTAMHDVTPEQMGEFAKKYIGSGRAWWAAAVPYPNTWPGL